MFFKRQVLVNTSPGANCVPSGTVTSVMKAAQSQYVIAVGTGVLVGGIGVAVGGMGVCVGAVCVIAYWVWVTIA
jgi:hypothetical protein